MIANIAYYISSHGYGHAARQGAIIKVLAQQGIKCHVRAIAPQKFFKQAASYHQHRYDYGMIQSDALHYDIPATLDGVLNFMAQQEAIIADELAFIKAQNIRLIVSDMPALACEIADRASVPSVVITHFTWDWVYEHYVTDYPRFAAIVDSIRQQYQKTTLALQMQIPKPHPFDMFPTVEPIALVYNQATQSRQQIRQHFNIPDEMPIILLSMGGHDWGDSNLEALKAIDDMVFLVMPSAWSQVQDNPEQFREVPMNFDDYHNLIAAADVLVGKAGGSTVAEIIGHRTPMIYTIQSEQWREGQLMAATLEDYASAQFIPMEDFIAGAWVEKLPDFLNNNHKWAAIDRNGTQQATQHILAFLD